MFCKQYLTYCNYIYKRKEYQAISDHNWIENLKLIVNDFNFKNLIVTKKLDGANICVTIPR